MYVGPELEFFYFANDKATDVLDQGGYFDGLPVDRATDLRRQTIFAMQDLGSVWSILTMKWRQASTKSTFVMTML